MVFASLINSIAATFAFIKQHAIVIHLLLEIVFWELTQNKLDLVLSYILALPGLFFPLFFSLL